MFPSILRDPDAAKKLFETIIDSPNGRRSMSRLARTCRAMCEPALNVLWRELDSLLPLISLFPNNLMKRSRRPGLGLAKPPNAEDWSRVLAYGERVRRIVYIESSPSVSPSVFAVIAENRPVQYILPHLQQLIWRVDTAAGLQRCTVFLNPELQSLVLEVSARIPQLADFLAEVCSTTQLSSFSFTSPTSLPDTFTDILRSYNTLEKLVLVAPGALSSGVGQWAASLPMLRVLELDLTGRSVIAVEGFFDDIITSGASTPSDASSDSGVFSGDEIDFTEIRKSSLRLTGDLRSGGVFTDLSQLSLTGEVANIAVFLKHLTSSITHLELVIEDPPDMADWQDLACLICERFSKSLLSLRINATGSSRFNELVRSTSRGGDPPCRHLPLQHITSLPCLLRLEIDLPESVLFHNSDLQAVAQACPNIETLRLCPMARFPTSSGPSLTLEGVAFLAQHCKRLHTLALVLDARTESAETFNSLEVSSRSLLRLHVGHSVVNDSLQTTILLSHLAPYLETIKWFHEKNRPGYVEANAAGWQKVSDWLPHMQGMRLMERARAFHIATRKPETREQCVDATVRRITADKGLQIKPRVVQRSIQVSPKLVDRSTEAKPRLVSASIDATPSIVDTGVDATPRISHQSVAVGPIVVSTGVDATTHTESKAVNAIETLPYEAPGAFNGYSAFPSVIPAVLTGLLTFACRILITYPLTIPMHMIDKSLSMLHAQQKDADVSSSEKHELRLSPASSSTSELLDHDIPPVCL
ncbi:hypothetical protein K503DRAFT_678944 [Rhizopogon vinicolor AM-OR11-026]|uniref:F-box domain-containing protein n=1 Tax=Rhizopogon vinicolor AM-OR11-026 TaxID=1314800 RepID=A0A1B7NI44_9AGAM|nr:hypothetical protein K503DRAFT_678944 [Rhizopogon vinicolor AM-OR11-026]